MGSDPISAKPAALIARIIGLTIILFLSFAVAGSVAGLQDPSQTTDQSGAAAVLLVVCFLDVLVFTYIILRSRWAGVGLMAAIFVAFYGVATFMGQIESAVFITRLPPGFLPRLFVAGALTAAPFAVLAVVILGKRKASMTDRAPNERLVMPAGEWAWKLAVIAVAYVILYFTFGYYIAWKNPALVEYYNGTDEGSFFAHMGTVLRDTPFLVPFQILRALLWTAIALPVIRMMKGAWWEMALAIGLLFSVVMNAQLLIPNPYMPETVRMSHLVEIVPSNFIFGLLIGRLLTQRHSLR